MQKVLLDEEGDLDLEAELADIMDFDSADGEKGLGNDATDVFDEDLRRQEEKIVQDAWPQPAVHAAMVARVTDDDSVLNDMEEAVDTVLEAATLVATGAEPHPAVHVPMAPRATYVDWLRNAWQGALILKDRKAKSDGVSGNLATTSLALHSVHIMHSRFDVTREKVHVALAFSLIRNQGGGRPPCFFSLQQDPYTRGPDS